jgi:hypothetical protein
LPTEFIERHIFPIRKQRVMLDFHLADMYGVLTKSLNLAVRRNIARFPADFMFQLTKEEVKCVEERLRLQSETSRSSGHAGRRYLPLYSQMSATPPCPSGLQRPSVNRSFWAPEGLLICRMPHPPTRSRR